MKSAYLLSGTSTERLDFQLIKQDDFDAWLPFFQSDLAIKHDGFGNKSSSELCQEWLDRQFMRYQSQRGGFNALIEKTTGTMIGHCGLLVQEIDGIIELEIGYALLPDYWGRGYAIEAAKHCKEKAFEFQWASSLISIITRENRRSQEVARKNGLKFEKISTFKGFEVMIFRVWAAN